jgi:hypothetical protein
MIMEEKPAIMPPVPPSGKSIIAIRISIATVTPAITP